MIDIAFFVKFTGTLLRNPGRALVVLYWYLTGRRVRARNRLRLLKAQSLESYVYWMFERERSAEREQAAPSALAGWAEVPLVSIFVYAENGETPDAWRRSFHSACRQVYPAVEVLLPEAWHWEAPHAFKHVAVNRFPDGAGEAAAGFLAALRKAQGTFVLPLCAGDVLPRTAVFDLVEALQNAPLSDIIYGDEDQLDNRGRRSTPYFKPEWNTELYLAQDYISHAFMMRRSAALAAEEGAPAAERGGAAPASRWILHHAANPGAAQPNHVSRIVCHRRTEAFQMSPQLPAVRSYLAVREPSATATRDARGRIKVAYPLPDPAPLVSLIVPTRDMLTFLRPCVDGLLNRTDYRNIEVIIVDNDSREASTLRYFQKVTAADSRVRILSAPGAFNYAAINNAAVQAARGTYVGLINNDTDVINPEWLTEMMRHAVRPHVGAVGAKLLYDDRTIQHAGVIIGLGGAAGHAHRFVSDDATGYFGHPHLPQSLLAVTAACLVVSREKYLNVEGLDAERLAVAFNDVDLCLKLVEAGWTNIYTPYATLFHHESKSRGHDLHGEKKARYLRELDYLQSRWGTSGFLDPNYNRNLTRHLEDFSIDYK